MLPLLRPLGFRRSSRFARGFCESEAIPNVWLFLSLGLPLIGNGRSNLILGFLFQPDAPILSQPNWGPAGTAFCRQPAWKFRHKKRIGPAVPSDKDRFLSRQHPLLHFEKPAVLNRL